MFLYDLLNGYIDFSELISVFGFNISYYLIQLKYE